jgi:hypothetical protein
MEGGPNLNIKVGHAALSKSEEPALDIVQLASALGSDWILLGFHRPVFGANYRGGTVGEVIQQITSLPINLGIVINGLQKPIERVDAIID